MSSRKSPFRGGGIPPLSFVEALNTSCLIPSLYSPKEDSVIAKIAQGDDLRTGFALDDLSNDRLLIESAQFDRINERELVKGIPCASVINAAYCHSHEEGNRFSVFDRNAWYAALTVETAQAEVIYHRTIDLYEVDEYKLEVTYDQYLADFRCELHDLRGLDAKSPILNPDSYRESQKLAEELFDRGSLGVIYQSVRDSHGTCIACFRPALVTNVRKGITYRFRWHGKDVPVAVQALGRR